MCRSNVRYISPSARHSGNKLCGVFEKDEARTALLEIKKNNQKSKIKPPLQSRTITTGSTIRCLTAFPSIFPGDHLGDFFKATTTDFPMSSLFVLST